MSILTKLEMKQEEIQKTLEVMSKSGITVAGDLVLEKKVEYEVNNVENGGIGIQIVNGDHHPATAPEQKELSKPRLAVAIENCQKYFWGNSAYAVVFCICRDLFKTSFSKTSFEEMVEGLPYKKKRSFSCPKGTIANAFSDNHIYNENISEWDRYNPLPRITILRDELLKLL